MSQAKAHLQRSATSADPFRGPRGRQFCVFCFVLLAAASCASDPSKGYSFRTTRPEGVRTVAVPLWENRTFSKGLEVQLTEAIVKEIQRSTPWVVTGRDNADTVLSGVIVDTRLRAMSIGRVTGLVLEQAVEISVDFDWRSRGTGKVLISRRSFEGLGSFVPAQGTQERLELGQAVTVQELARDIVAELRSNW